MIIFDASYLIVYLHPNPEPAMDRENKPVTRFRERVDHLIATLNGSGQLIGIPTPALAEVLVRAGAARGGYVNILTDSYRFEILPFGVKAAIEAGELIAMVQNEHKSQPVSNWAKVKFDVQIASIAKAKEATVVYSDDKHLEAHGKRLNFKVVRICDLDLPPIQTEQQKAEERDRLETGRLFTDEQLQAKDEASEAKQEQPKEASNDSTGLQADSPSGAGDATGAKKEGPEAKT